MLKYEKSVKEIDRSLNIVKDYENEVDHLKSKLREKEFEIEQVNEFYNKTLEDLAIACSELDFVKDLSQENMHRLREQVSDLNNELNVAKRKSVSFQAYFGHRVEQSLQKTNMKTILAGKSAQSIVDILLSNLSTSLLKYKQASI